MPPTPRRATMVDILVAGILALALKGEPLRAAEPEVPTHARRTPRRVRRLLDDSPTLLCSPSPSSNHAARGGPRLRESE
jgi:hypothetical protein